MLGFSVVLLAALLPGWTKRHGQGSGSEAAAPHRAGTPMARPAASAETIRLTDAEQKYGIAPIPDSTVTYRSDVIAEEDSPAKEKWPA